MEAAEMFPEAWVKMMFLDGCFILRHLCNYARGVDERELHQSWWAPAQLRSDLTLLENQIPVAVLVALFNHLAPPDLLPRNADDKEKRRRLLDMALWYMFRGSLPPNKRPTAELDVYPEVPVDHLLHLLHLAKCAQLNAAHRRPEDEAPTKRDLRLRGFISALPIGLMRLLRLLRCNKPCQGDIIHRRVDRTEHVPSAAELKAMGIRIMRPTTRWPEPHWDGTVLDVRFMEDSVRLEIPPLYLELTTASLLPNLIAFEQQVGAVGGDYFTTYAFLMSQLVSTPEDIILLQSLRILHNNFGSDRKVINYFRNLCAWSPHSGLTPIDTVLRDLRMCLVYGDVPNVKIYTVKILLLIISAMVSLSTIMQAVLAVLAIRQPTGH